VLSGKNPLIIALALGLFAGLIAYSAIKAQQKKVRKEWETVRIVCAAQDIPDGTELGKDMIEECDMPSRFVTESFIRADTSRMEMPYGQRVMVPLKKGDPVLVSHFESSREAEFSRMIQHKARAVTIEVQERSSVGHWVRPNDRVDIVGTFRDSEKNDLRTITLLQDVIVLATGRMNANTTYVAEEDKRYQSVTVAVLPEEAELLTLAQESGTLTLLLRNPEDIDVQEKRNVVDAKTLLQGDRTGELQAKRYKTIQIIRGGRHETRENTGVQAKAE
jgi:pilus assembly protein CpaB